MRSGAAVCFYMFVVALVSIVLPPPSVAAPRTLEEFKDIYDRALKKIEETHLGETMSAANSYSRSIAAVKAHYQKAGDLNGFDLAQSTAVPGQAQVKEFALVVTTDEQVALEFGQAIAGVKDEAGGSDDGGPLVQGFLAPIIGVRAGVTGMNAPAVVGAGQDQV